MTAGKRRRTATYACRPCRVGNPARLGRAQRIHRSPYSLRARKQTPAARNVCASGSPLCREQLTNHRLPRKPWPSCQAIRIETIAVDLGRRSSARRWALRLFGASCCPLIRSDQLLNRQPRSVKLQPSCEFVGKGEVVDAVLDDVGPAFAISIQKLQVSAYCRN